MGLFDTPETQIAPPKFPLTAHINQAITDFYFDHFASKYLSPYQVVKTSGLREADHNADVGGVENSAHLHGLAVDFQLWNAGKRVPLSEEARVFTQVIQPNWPGYALNEPDKNHVHVNLTRQITLTTGLTSFAVMGLVGAKVVKNLMGPKKGRRK